MRRPIAAVVTICTHRKRIRPPVTATAVSLPADSQAAVQSAWIGKIQTLDKRFVRARSTRGGDSEFAIEAARIAEAKLLYPVRRFGFGGGRPARARLWAYRVGRACCSRSRVRLQVHSTEPPGLPACCRGLIPKAGPTPPAGVQGVC